MKSRGADRPALALPSECCAGGGERVGKPPAARCPKCDVQGQSVSRVTIDAILRSERARERLQSSSRYCATPSCEILYYDEKGGFASKLEAATRVGVKETTEPIPACYCFGITRKEILDEAATGSSSLVARIASEVRVGRCECEVKNPSGKCCLGEIRAFLGRSEGK
jgi:hypothetical protein